MSNQGFHIEWDFSEYLHGIAHFERVYRMALVEGMTQAGMMLLRDSQQEVPGVPVLTGFLLGSGSVLVDGKMVKRSDGTLGNPALSEDEDFPGVIVNPSMITVVVGYNTPYAAVMHEGRWETGPLAGVEITNWTREGTGKYFLLTPMTVHKDEYFQAAVEYARRKVGM